MCKPPCVGYEGNATLSVMKRKVRCPTCKKEGDWFEGKYGPFCSKRCKLVDLGKWLNEEHKVSEPLDAEQIGDQKNADGPSALQSEED